MVKNNIVFLPSHSYISIPQYFSVVPKITDFNTIYLDAKDPIGANYNKSFYENKESILEYFNSYHELSELPFDIGVKLTTWEKIKKLKVFKDYKRMVETYLDEIKPSAIVSTSDMSTSDKICSVWCKKNKVPYIILQSAKDTWVRKDKIGIKFKIKYFIINELLGIPKYRKQPLLGNEAPWSFLLLWSKPFGGNMIRENTYFVGNPAYDKLFNNFSQTRTIKNNICICTSPLSEISSSLDKKMKQMYIEAVRRKPDITFYIKIHPRESVEPYQQFFPKEKYPNVNFLKDYDLHELYRNCDAQMSSSSNTSLEAAAMGLPIIILNPKDESEQIEHFWEEIAIKVTDQDKITDAINLVMSKEYWDIFLEKRGKYFNKMLYSDDGQSGRRAAEKIIEIIQNFT